MTSPRWLTVLAWAACLIVVGTVVAGLLQVGSPTQARREKADNARVEDLENLARGVREYYRVHKALPKTLDALSYPGADARQDPVTRAPYAYRVLEPDAFELCADFETDQRERSGRGYWHDETLPFWRHQQGRQCFRVAAGP